MFKIEVFEKFANKIYNIMYLYFAHQVNNSLVQTDLAYNVRDLVIICYLAVDLISENRLILIALSKKQK